MSNTTSSSTVLADALATLSRTAHRLVADVETRSRTEVANAVSEASDARAQRDKALKDYRTAQVETQAWKEETSLSKAALGQAELTIAHQTDTINQQNETIMQLRRELAQWKDQSHNWQEHFLRVEQERCALSSKIDELISERLVQWNLASAATSSLNLSTPQPRYGVGQSSSSHSSSTGKQRAYHSPIKDISTDPQVYEESDTLTASKQGSSSKQRKTAVGGRQAGRQVVSSAKSKLPLQQPTGDKSTSLKTGSVKPTPSQLQRSTKERHADKNAAIRQSTVIRRVRAVVHVKREEGSDAEGARPKDDGSSRMEHRRRASRQIVQDEDHESEEDLNGQSSEHHLRPKKPIHYPDETGPDGSGESSEEDELTIGNESRFGMSNPLTTQRTKVPEHLDFPAKKKRKITTNVP